MSRIPKILRQSHRSYRILPRDGTGIPKRVSVDQSRIDLANKYFVNDLAEAVTPGTRLHNILEKLEQSCSLSLKALMYLQQKQLLALQQFAQSEISYEAFRKIANGELSIRSHGVEAKRKTQEAVQLQRIEENKVKYERDQLRAKEAQRKLKSDPKYIAKIKNQQLRKRYGLDQFIETQFFTRLMDILHRFERGNRLSDEDVLWFTTKGKDYYTEILQVAFHEREAEFYTTEYKRTSNPWNVVNASSHYRKCNQARKAHDLLTSIPDGRRKVSKLNSAICTTHGGVMRDLKRFDEALKLGEQAHALTTKDFRPCTLLGAVNFEIGNYGIGKDWYDKAEKRGASKCSIDCDLRGILLRADNVKREKLKAFLLHEDPERYNWIRNLKFKGHVSA